MRSFAQVLPRVNQQPLDIRSEIAMIEVDQLTVRYGDKTAISNVSISFPKQKVTALIGPPGCGKST